MIDWKGLCLVPYSSTGLESEELGAGLAGLGTSLSESLEAVDPSSGEVGLFHLSSNLCPRPCS